MTCSSTWSTSPPTHSNGSSSDGSRWHPAVRAGRGLASVEIGPQQMADAANANAAFATVSVFVADLTHPRVAMKRGTITRTYNRNYYYSFD
jgi:hypothetical protein